MKPPPPSRIAPPRDRTIHRPGHTLPVDAPAARASRASFRPGRRVLLVDNDPTVRDSLNDVLVAEGYFVLPAENGQEALTIAANAKVDLVLLDLNMPVKNGWDTFEEFTREHPLISIIIVTARPNQLFTAAGVGAGALLEKPMDIPTLLRTMETLLAETPEQRLARRAGQQAQFHYNPATPRPANRANDGQSSTGETRLSRAGSHTPDAPAAPMNTPALISAPTLPRARSQGHHDAPRSS